MTKTIPALSAILFTLAGACSGQLDTPPLEKAGTEIVGVHLNAPTNQCFYDSDCVDGNSCTINTCEPADPAHPGQHLRCVATPVVVGAACDDGNACTSGDSCTAQGVCSASSMLACNDENPCTDDRCNPTTGCVNTANTESCDDSSACTENDTCVDGVCVGGAAISCDDENPCTDDSCDPGAGCVFTNNTASCDDGSACTSGDICTAGVCGGAAISCDDENPCTDDSCDPDAGCLNTNNVAACDDGSACTEEDTCMNGTCTGSILYEGCCEVDMDCFTAEPPTTSTGYSAPCSSDSDCQDGRCFQGTMCLPSKNVFGCTGTFLEAGVGTCEVCNNEGIEGSDCWSFEKYCADGFDDDADGAIDCLDADCAQATECQAPECQSASDCTGNNRQDCVDNVCVLIPEGDLVGDCTDGIDNDGNGAIDCLDSGCADAPECLDPCTAGVTCDDGNACNGVETCVEGACVNGTPVTCDPGLVCDATGQCVTQNQPDSIVAIWAVAGVPINVVELLPSIACWNQSGNVVISWVDAKDAPGAEPTYPTSTTTITVTRQNVPGLKNCVGNVVGLDSNGNRIWWAVRDVDLKTSGTWSYAYNGYSVNSVGVVTNYVGGGNFAWAMGIDSDGDGVGDGTDTCPFDSRNTCVVAP